MGSCFNERFPARQTSYQFTKPPQCQPDCEDEDGTSHDLPYSCPRGFEVEFSERHKSGHPHDKHEEGKHQVGWGKSMPWRMPERFVNIAPRTRIIDHDHSGNGNPPEDIEREQPAASLRLFDVVHNYR